MVTLRGRPDDSPCGDEGSGLVSRAGQLDDQMREFIPSEITHHITYQTFVIVGMIKEGSSEICD